LFSAGDIQDRIDEPKGDPGNVPTKDELEAKAIRLAGFRDDATPAEYR
jgi:hypothetical protein